MSQREVAIVGSNNTKAKVTGQEELLVKVNSYGSGRTLTPTIVRSTTSGTIPANIGFSVANVGSANGTINGVILKTGETINFDPGSENISTTTFNATGTEFLIIYLTA
jgi:hypothetical protein